VSRLSSMTSEYVGRIAVAVWIGKLSDEAAREALKAYAAAYHSSERSPPEILQDKILAEYRYRREGQDLCS
jgi:hypothetical protein